MLQQVALANQQAHDGGEGGVHVVVVMVTMVMVMLQQVAAASHRTQDGDACWGVGRWCWRRHSHSNILAEVNKGIQCSRNQFIVIIKRDRSCGLAVFTKYVS